MTTRTVLLSCALVFSAGLTSGPPARGADDKPKVSPVTADLSGRWVYNRELSDDAREKMRAAQQTLADAQPGDPDYDARTAEARKTLQETRGQMRTEMENFRSRTDAVLTPEQRTQVEARRSEMRERMGERRGERGGMGGGRGGRRPRSP